MGFWVKLTAAPARVALGITTFLAVKVRALFNPFIKPSKDPAFIEGAIAECVQLFQDEPLQSLTLKFTTFYCTHSDEALLHCRAYSTRTFFVKL